MGQRTTSSRLGHARGAPDGPAKRPALVGQTITAGDMAITILDAHLLPAGFYGDPADPYAYVELDVRIANRAAKDDVVFSESAFSVKDVTNGYTFTQLMYPRGPELGMGTIGAGEFTRGNVVIEIAKGSHDLRVRYDPADVQTRSFVPPRDQPMHWLIADTDEVGEPAF